MKKLLAIMAAIALHANAVEPVSQAIPVLMYHQFTESKPPGITVITPKRFDEHMKYLADNGYTTLSTSEVVSIMEGTMQMPPKPVAITIDDGWRSQLQGIKVLDKYKFKASFWIISDMAGGDYQYLGWHELKQIAANPRYEIQSHTKSHPYLDNNNLITWMDGRPEGKGPEDVRVEIIESKRALEQELGRPINFLAWPLGLYNETMVQWAKDAGYTALVTTEDGPANVVHGDVFRIKRIEVHGGCDLGTFITALSDFKNRRCDAQ